MHLADTFIQSDLQCIQAIHFFFISIHLVYELLMEMNETIIHSGPAGLTNYSWGQDLNSAINQLSERVTAQGATYTVNI